MNHMLGKSEEKTTKDIRQEWELRIESDLYKILISHSTQNFKTLDLCVFL